MQTPLAQVLGARSAGLASSVAALHTVPGHRRFRGRATVKRGQGWGLLAAMVAGFPPPMQDAEFLVEVVPEGNVERWIRRFGRAQTVSVLWAEGAELRERFGPVTTTLSPEVRPDGTLLMGTGAAAALKVPLPGWLAPKGDASVWDEDGRYVFDIGGYVPLVGRVIHYQGWLQPEVP